MSMYNMEQRIIQSLKHISYDYNLSGSTIAQTFEHADGTSVSGVVEGNYTTGCYFNSKTVESIKTLNKGVYNTIIAEANKTTITLPPSAGAVAGYMPKQTNRGVWKSTRQYSPKQRGSSS